MNIFDNISSLDFIEKDENLLDIESLENDEAGENNFNEPSDKGNKPDSESTDNDLQGSSLDDDVLKELEEFEEPDSDIGIDDEEIKHKKDNTSSDESFSPVTSLASSLFEEGVLANLTEEEVKGIKTGEDLINAVKKQIKENEFSDLTDEQKEYLDAIRKGVSLEEFAKSKESYDSYNAIADDDVEAEENKDLRFQLIKNSFLLKGFDDDKAEKLTKRAFDTGDDIDDAKTALLELKDYEKGNIENLKKEKELERKQLIEAQAKEYNMIKNYINTSEEIIPGIKINDDAKKNIESLISKPYTKDKNGNQVNEVVGKMIEDKEYFVKLHYIHHITDGFKNFDKLVSKAKSQAVKSLEEKLKLQDSRMSTSRQVVPSKFNDGLFKAIDKFI
jgi:hypothetical protein